MTVFLRFVGIVNAAIWFGAAIFFTFGAGPAVFSPEMKSLFSSDPTAARYFAGGVALVLVKRYFILQHICGFVALMHMYAERLYISRRISGVYLSLLLVMFFLGLMGHFWLGPRMEDLRKQMYSAPLPQQKEQAQRSFGVLHGVSQGVNLLIVAGLLVYLVRMNQPPEAARFSTFPSFRS